MSCHPAKAVAAQLRHTTRRRKLAVRQSAAIKICALFTNFGIGFGTHILRRQIQVAICHLHISFCVHLQSREQRSCQTSDIRILCSALLTMPRVLGEDAA